MRTTLAFFDQYGLSHRPWSPDGSAFLLCGRIAGDGTSWSFSDRQNDYVLLWEPAVRAPLEVVATGEVAFFSPV
jgi:hypothetical protein